MNGEFQFLSSLRTTWGDESSTVSLCLLARQNPQFWCGHVPDLSPREAAKCERLGTIHAKNSFCMGNLAAKLAFNQLSVQTSLNKIEIEYGVFGFPVIQTPRLGFCTSIAHTDKAAAAVCFQDSLFMGIDLEYTNQANNTAIRATMTETEHLLKERIQLPETNFLHHLWTAKEALGKALKTGFLLPMHLLEVKSIEPKNGCFELCFTGFSLLKAVSFPVGNYVLTLVFPSKCVLDIEPMGALSEKMFNPAILEQQTFFG